MWDYTPLPEDTEQGFMDGLKDTAKQIGVVPRFW